MEPTVHIHQEHLAGIESEPSLSNLPSTSQEDPSLSSSYIFQKISQGKQMCQKLKEQTDQLKAKVQEFSKCIAQDSPYHFQHRRLVLEKLQGRLKLLEQEFLANKEKHLTLEEQVHKHESPAVKDFDPERKIEGEIFKLEMLLKDFKEKINKSKRTSAVSLPVNSPINLDDLSFTSSPPLNEEEPSTASGRQDRAETTSASCAFCLRVLQWKQKMEKKDHRGIDCGRFPTAIQDKMLHPDSVLGSDTGYSCCSASRIGLQSKFHYRYNTPGQNFFNHTERSAFAQLRYLNENNSSPTHSKPKWICFQRANPKYSNDGCEPIPRKSDLATLSPHSHSCRISENTSSSNFSSNKETESEILNSSLDHALRTATILKQTTDQMIRTIAEDLAKVQRWRKKLKY